MENVKAKPLKKILFIETNPISSHLLKAQVHVDGSFVNSIYSKTLEIYQIYTKLSGFNKQKTPLEYLQENYKNAIDNSVKNFLFKHSVLDFLMEQMREKQICLVNYPRLIEFKKTSENQMSFLFDLSIADSLELKEWKNFVFRSPKRKRYKDLDKQVNLFIKKEIHLVKKKSLDSIQEDDWVCIQATLLTQEQEADQLTNSFWIKVNTKYITKPFQATLIGKFEGDTFITDSLPLKNDFSDELEYAKYPFLIKIKAIAKGRHLYLEQFKNTFKLKSKLDVHKKLIEVFSYRNDISQRKSIIEEVFHLFLSKHRFEVPKHFVIRRIEEILGNLRQHPDYQVYKMQEDFDDQVTKLAEKQLKEEILIDQIAFKENMKIEIKDLQQYLHLFNNNRLKEFIYFKPSLERLEDSDTLLQNGLLKQSVLREKTLNYIIYILTR